MTKRVSAPAGSYRMVIYNGVGVTASLYPRDATAYSKPLATMQLSPLQELPIMEPGAEVEAAKDFESVSFGDTRFVPVGPAIPTWPGTEGRIFAERGNVIVNPETPGWEHTWRSVPNESAQPMERFRRQARRDVWNMMVSLGFIVLFAVLLARSSASGSGLFYAGSAGSVASTVQLGRRAFRSLRTLKRAGDAATLPGRQFKMLLRWAVGHGHGPIAVALLWSDEEERKRVRRVPVVGVPSGPFPEEPVDVIVRGQVASGAYGSIAWGEHVLWPVG